MAHENLLNNKDALEYILSGKALITIVSKATGNRYTFQVKKDKKNRPLHYLRLLRGPDNTKDYTNLGAIIDGNKVITTKYSTVSQDALSFKAIKYTIHKLALGTLEDVEVYRYNRCGRCGAVLTVPHSILDGYGPVCGDLVLKSRNTQLSLLEQNQKD